MLDPDFVKTDQNVHAKFDYLNTLKLNDYQWVKKDEKRDVQDLLNATYGWQNSRFPLRLKISKTKVSFDKVDTSGENQVNGAKMKLEQTSPAQKEIATWDSKEGIDKELELEYPGTYKLTETSAPQGWEIAQPITFEIRKDGKVYVGGQQVSGDPITIEMKDNKKQKDVTVSKVEVGGTTPIAGA